MGEIGIVETAKAFYAALAAGDREQLDRLLDPSFVGQAADGLPFDMGGKHPSPTEMRRKVWGTIAKHFVARVEPEEYVELKDGRLLVSGRYRGHGRQDGRSLDAAFVHLLTIDDGRLLALSQHTDTARWREAAGPLRTVLLDCAEGLATVRLNRPSNGNAINADMAADLLEVATQLVERTDVRAVLIVANGTNFTVGGDLEQFSSLSRLALPNTLRRMIDNYHLAIDRLTSIDAPVVAAVRGGVGGGGLGLVHAADIVIAADDSRYALGYGALGLTSDGGSTWYLPRMVGLRQAQLMFLLNQRLTAEEALKFGLVSRLVPADNVDAEALAIAKKLAQGPTKSIGATRRLLRQSFETGLAAQLEAEKQSIIAASATDDAAEGIAAFTGKRRPNFKGT